MMMMITSTAWAAPIVTSADCDTITVQIGEDIPAPRIPILYVTKVAVADGDRTWELSAGDVLDVDRSWPGSAWAVWVHGDLVASGERDHSCEWVSNVVVDVDADTWARHQAEADVTNAAILSTGLSPGSDLAPSNEAEPAVVPAGIRWF